MIRIKCILVVTLLLNKVYAIDLNKPVGGRSVAMGRTSVCERGIWALQNNPAGLALTKEWGFGAYYENQWMLKATAFKYGGIAKGIPKVGCIGLSCCQFGGASYSENQFGLCYARDFGSYLQLGLRADYLLLHWGEGYSNQGAFSFTLGLQSQVTEKLQLGACLFNPIHSRLGTLNKDALPIVMRLGIAYQFTEDFVGQCELGYNSSRAGFSLHGGLEYLVFKQFYLRAGVQSNPNILSFGLSYQLGPIQVEVSAEMHQAMGASMGVGMKWKTENGKRKTENANRVTEIRVLR